MINSRDGVINLRDLVSNLRALVINSRNLIIILRNWHNKTIVPGVQLINNRLADIHIRRLRCWVHTEIFVGPNNKALCLHFDQIFTPFTT